MKKRFLSMFVLILAIISMQIVVFADMDAPSVKPYTATISNVDGANCYDYSYNEDFTESKFEKIGELQYGETVEIMYEEYIEGEHYALSFSEGSGRYIKIGDIKIVAESSIEPSKDALKTGKEAVVLVEGIELYEGPAYGYEKEGTVLSKGTKITLYNDDENAGNPWYFAEARDGSGWICILNGAVGIKGKNADYYEKDMEIMTGKETKVYKDTTYKEIVGRIPANTKIENFLDIDDWSWGIYVDYKGISGYVQSEDYATNFPWSEEKTLQYIVDYPAKIYTEADFRSEVIVDEVPMGTELTEIYAVNTKMTTWIHVTYNGIRGWLFDVSEHLYEDTTYQDVIDEYMKYYETEEINSVDVAQTVKDEDIIDEDIKNDEKDIIVENEGKATLYSISGMQIVLICVGFAVVLALTVFVTIILVNKSNKKTEVKEESKKE